jgi:hypothetical protein
VTGRSKERAVHVADGWQATCSVMKGLVELADRYGEPVDGGVRIATGRKAIAVRDLDGLRGRAT